jgi:ATP-dependent DNA helicase RecG
VNETTRQVIGEKQLAFELGKFPPPRIPALWSVEQIYEHASTRLFKMLKEDRRIERKSPKTEPRALADCFSMWANTPEGGVLVIGIENDGSIVGLRECSNQTINEIEDCPRVYCPDARFQSKRVSVENHKGLADFVIVFWVPYRKDKAVRTTSGKVFKRSAASKCELHDDEIRELQIEKGELQLELEPINLRFPYDFDRGLLEEFRKNIAIKKGLTLQHLVEEILVQQKLGEFGGDEFFPNIACCLLFASDPRTNFPGCKLRFMRFEGEFEKTGQDYNCVKDITIDGPIPKIIVESEKIISGQLREFSALGSDGRFYAVPEYPQVAWYEAVVNACVHRSYNLRNMNIFVKMFDDKLVVSSPGPFPAMVTPENIYEMHHPRNPFIMDALRYLEFVKCANEGTRRMRDAMAESSLPLPKFEQSHTGAGNVTVTFQNNHKQRRKFIDSNAANTVVSETLFKILTEDEKRLINHAVEYKTIKVAQAAKLLDKDWATAKKVLERLKSKGVFIRNIRKDIVKDSKAYYELSPKLSK